MGGFGLDYLPATSSSSESSWHQPSAPSGTWAAQGPPAMEDSSAVLMESLKVCLTGTLLRNACWSVGLPDPAMGFSLLQASEFSIRNRRFFPHRFAYAGSVGGVTGAGRCHRFPVLAVLEYFAEQDQAGRTGRNYNICFD